MHINDLLAALVSRLAPPPQPSKPTCEAWLLEAAANADGADDLVMYMSHWNGYVREAATKRAGQRIEPRTLEAIVERLNDWVPQVRAAARAAIADFVHADRFEDVLQAWPAIRRLRGRSREDHNELVDILETWLAGHPRRPRLVDLVRGSDPVFVRALFALELRSPSRDLPALIDWGLKCGDIVTSKLACDLVRSLDDPQRLEFALRLLRARRGYLRLAGLNYLNEIDADNARGAARKLLLSAYAPLRQRSEQLSGIGHEELADVARGALVDAAAPVGRRIVAATLCGKKEFASCKAQLAALLDRSNAALYAASLLALFRLAPDAYEGRVKDALTERDPRIVRAALQAVAESYGSLEPGNWCVLIQALSSRSLASMALRVAQGKNKWDWLAVALELTARDAVADIGIAAIWNWLNSANRSFEELSPTHRQWIARLLDACLVDRATEKLLRFHLG